MMDQTRREPSQGPSEPAPVATPRRLVGQFAWGATVGFFVAAIASYVALIFLSSFMSWFNTWFLSLAETVGAILLVRAAIKTRRRGFVQGQLVGGATGLLLGAAFWWFSTSTMSGGFGL